MLSEKYRQIAEKYSYFQQKRHFVIIKQCHVHKAKLKKSMCAHFPVRSHSRKLSPSQVFGSACALLCGLPSRKTVINCFSLVTQRATLVVLITRRSWKDKPASKPKRKKPMMNI